MKKHLVLTISLILIACSKGNLTSGINADEIKLLKGSKPPKHVELTNRQALLTGYLIVKNDCLYAQRKKQETENPILLYWRWNTSLKVSKNTIKIVDTDQSSAEVGRINHFGGGFSTIKKQQYIKGCRIYDNQVFNVDNIQAFRDDTIRNKLKRFMRNGTIY